jgi:hypothetical protein
MSDIERRVSDLEATEQARKAVDQIKEQHRATIDKELMDAVKCLRNEVHELKSWKMKLQYPFAIIGVFVVGGFTWLGANLFRFFTGE